MSVHGFLASLVSDLISGQKPQMHFGKHGMNPPRQQDPQQTPQQDPQQSPSKHHSVGLGNLLAAVLGGGITNFLKPSKQLGLLGGFPIATKSAFSFPNFVFGIGGATVGIGGGLVKGFQHCEEKLELAAGYHEAQCDSTIRQLDQTYSKELLMLQRQLAGTETQLNETQSSLQDVQHRVDYQYTISLALLAGIVLLVIVVMYQNLQHKEERHKWIVSYNLQNEKAFQEKLQQQKKILENQKLSLDAALEEKKLQQQLLRAHHPMQHGQPLVLTLPPGFGQAAGERPGNRI